MKRIVLLSIAVSFLASCSVFKPVRPHTNQFVYLWTKPVSVDPTRISPDSKKDYLVEGYLSNGAPILIFVKAKIMKDVMNLKWPEGGIRMNESFEGFAFTADGLGSKSYLTKREINKNPNFDDAQKELLLRYHDREKFELLSSLPIKAVGKVEDEKVVLVQQNSPISSQGSSGTNTNSSNFDLLKILEEKGGKK